MVIGSNVGDKVGLEKKEGNVEVDEPTSRKWQLLVIYREGTKMHLLDDAHPLTTRKWLRARTGRRIHRAALNHKSEVPGNRPGQKQCPGGLRPIAAIVVQ